MWFGEVLFGGCFFYGFMNFVVELVDCRVVVDEFLIVFE